MAAFNLFSHATQDLYPNAFLRGQHKLLPAQVATIAVVYNLGAISGCILAGTLSQRLGRRSTIMTAAIAALVVIPFWAYASGMVWLGLTAFLMQFCVQAAFGVVPAHLNEIAPGEVRGTFAGLTSQIGNLLAAGTATLQSTIADHMDHNFSLAMAGTAAVGAVAVAVLVRFGREARDSTMTVAPDPASDDAALTTPQHPTATGLRSSSL
jgi:SHS family lactate transporter-like MFS transporter